MPKVSFRMASVSRESVFGVQTNTARKTHRSDHTEGRLTTAPSGCCVRKGAAYGCGAAEPTDNARSYVVSGRAARARFEPVRRCRARGDAAKEQLEQTAHELRARSRPA